MTTENKNDSEKLTDNDTNINELNTKIKAISENLENLQFEITNCKDKLLPELTEQITITSNTFITDKDKIVNELEEKIKTHIDEIDKIKEQLAQLNGDYQTKYIELEETANQLTEFEKKSLELKNEISQYHNEIFTGDSSYKVQLENLYADYIKKSKEINRLNSKIFITTNIKTDKIITKEEYNNLPESDENKYQNENDQYVKLEKRISIEEQINSINKKFSKELEEFTAKATNSINNNEKNNEKLREDLQEMINNLVSGATTAGLAKSHEKAKMNIIKKSKIGNLLFKVVFYL